MQGEDIGDGDKKRRADVDTHQKSHKGRHIRTVPLDGRARGPVVIETAGSLINLS